MSCWYLRYSKRGLGWEILDAGVMVVVMDSMEVGGEDVELQTVTRSSEDSFYLIDKRQDAFLFPVLRYHT